MAELNLLVLRSADIDQAAEFYGVFGLTFTKHRHGAGPEHYSCASGSVVFELYPRKEGDASSSETRLGFRVDSVDDTVHLLVKEGARVVSPPKDSAWGRRAVVVDLDGHWVELTEENTRGESNS